MARYLICRVWYPLLSPKMSRTSVTIPDHLLTWFKAYCERQKRSVSAQFSFMIENLKEEEERKARENE